jgi:hypothetical protein
MLVALAACRYGIGMLDCPAVPRSFEYRSQAIVLKDFCADILMFPQQVPESRLLPQKIDMLDAGVDHVCASILVFRGGSSDNNFHGVQEIFEVEQELDQSFNLAIGCSLEALDLILVRCDMDLRKRRGLIAAECLVTCLVVHLAQDNIHGYGINFVELDLFLVGFLSELSVMARQLNRHKVSYPESSGE